MPRRSIHWNEASREAATVFKHAHNVSPVRTRTRQKRRCVVPEPPRSHRRRPWKTHAHTHPETAPGTFAERCLWEPHAGSDPTVRQPHSERPHYSPMECCGAVTVKSLRLAKQEARASQRSQATCWPPGHLRVCKGTQGALSSATQDPTSFSLGLGRNRGFRQGWARCSGAEALTAWPVRPEGGGPARFWNA